MKLIKLLMCGVFHHKIILLRKYPDLKCKRIYCKRCKGEWGVNELEKIVIEWDAELAELHKDNESAQDILNAIKKDRKQAESIWSLIKKISTSSKKTS